MSILFASFSAWFHQIFGARLEIYFPLSSLNGVLYEYAF